MSKRYKKLSAYTGIQDDNNAFTFVSLLFSLSILLIILPLLPLLLHSLNPPNHYKELSVRQFFHFISDEIYTSKDLVIQGNKLSFTKQNDEVVTIEFYNQLVRRQVTGKGSEILIREIEQWNIQTLSYGFIITITTTEGDVYEKKFGFY